MKKIFISILFIISGSCLLSQNLAIEFDNIRNNKGVVYVTIYETEDTWLDENFDYYEFIFSKENVSNNKLAVLIDSLKPGYYGIAILDDEDEDGTEGQIMGLQYVAGPDLAGMVEDEGSPGLLR